MSVFQEVVQQLRDLPPEERTLEAAVEFAARGDQGIKSSALKLKDSLPGLLGDVMKWVTTHLSGASMDFDTKVIAGVAIVLVALAAFKLPGIARVASVRSTEAHGRIRHFVAVDADDARVLLEGLGAGARLDAESASALRSATRWIAAIRPSDPSPALARFAIEESAKSTFDLVVIELEPVDDLPGLQRAANGLARADAFRELGKRGIAVATVSGRLNKAVAELPGFFAA